MLYQTQMRTRMAIAATLSKTAKRSVISAVSHSYDAGAGIVQVKDWNAHLSLPTYRRLKSQGIMA